MKSLFILGSGKCGESFLNRLFKNNKNLECYDESRPLLQSYYKFIKYNNLKIDDSPFFSTIKKAIKNTNKKKKIYLESSSFLAFHSLDLVKKFNSKIIILIRNPNHVSQDLTTSGWYKSKYNKNNNNYALGYQGLATSAHNKHHNFSRIAPRNKYFSKWNKLQPLVKAKWYWNEVNTDLLKSIKKMNKQNYKIFKIEEFEYQNYQEICKWLKIKPNLSKIQFILMNNIERFKNTKIIKKKIDLLKKFKSKTEKQYYPENFNKK
ncbi:MAG: hypothetical protein CBE14_003550 [Rickettsiales bacterium TMED254]|nr:MAG: hypothetical protein CBE14_003550 [Rickettsiales bacterium TMED254]